MEEKEKEKESSVIQLTDFKIEVLIHPLPQAAKDLHFADIRLEAHDVPSKQAEAITAVMTGVLNDSLENVAHSFVSKAEMQKSEMIQHANLSKFKSEAQSSQEHHFSLLQHETEKFRGDIEKMRNELKYEIDMVTGGQCLDLTLERGCIRDELAKQNAETTNKLDREIHALRAHLEAAMTHRFKELLSSSNLPSTFSPKLISIKASTSSALNSRENKQRDIGLLKHWMSRSSVGLQEKRNINVLCYQHSTVMWLECERQPISLTD
ncbi:hypothetical protein DKX38_019572 [Salix brachista]|uniref:Uncharacterized protein n=1 Tax=Salix brachista TaxID=2182728 RepID=A0A5N5KGK8_9ROSI|nr:hypothetical protein DKX38_019572 [Salix brachista]